MRLLLLCLFLLLPGMIFKRRMEQDHFLHRLNFGSQHRRLDLCACALLLNCTQLSVAPWAGSCQVSLSVGSPDKNPGAGCHFLIRGSCCTRDQTHICMGRWILYLGATRKAPYLHLRYAKKYYLRRTEE